MSTCTRHREQVFKSNSQLGGGLTEGEMQNAAYHNRRPRLL